MRTVAGPSSAAQCVLSGGPYTVSSHVRQVQVVWPPPWPRQATCPTRTCPAPSWWPLGQRASRGRPTIHCRRRTTGHKRTPPSTMDEGARLGGISQGSAVVDQPDVLELRRYRGSLPREHR